MDSGNPVDSLGGVTIMLRNSGNWNRRRAVKARTVQTITRDEASAVMRRMDELLVAVMQLSRNVDRLATRLEADDCHCAHEIPQAS